jgi:hypothetical protein
MMRRKIAVLSIFGVLTIGFIMSLLLPPHGFNNQSPLERDRLMATDAQLQRLGYLLVYIHEQNDKFPKNIEEFTQHEVFQEYMVNKEQYGTTIKQIVTDSWNEYFIYHRINQNEAVLISKGPDKTLNTSDDMQIDVVP